MNPNATDYPALYCVENYPPIPTDPSLSGSERLARVLIDAPLGVLVHVLETNEFWTLDLLPNNERGFVLLAAA